MLSEAIKSRLIERFTAPLPEFHKRRIVFWNDENGEFAEQIDELTLPNVTLVRLTGRNNFAVKTADIRRPDRRLPHLQSYYIRKIAG